MSSKLFSYTMKSHFALKSIPYQYTINHIRFVSIRWGARKSTSRIDYRWHIQLIPTSTLVSFERRAQFKQKLYFKKMHIISCFKLHNCAEQFAPIVLTTMHGGYVVLPPPMHGEECKRRSIRDAQRCIIPPFDVSRKRY